MALKLTRNFPYTLTVDGQPVRLHFKKMTVEEFAIFYAEFEAHQEDRTPAAASPGPASLGLTAAQRAELEANAAWLRATFAAYVTVEPGDLEIDGAPILTGVDFFNAMGMYAPILVEVLTNLCLAQCLTESQKKTLRSQPTLPTGSSTALPPAGNGEPPAPVVAPAAPAGSAESAPAINPASALFGTTDPLSCAPALSAS